MNKRKVLKILGTKWIESFIAGITYFPKDHTACNKDTNNVTM